MRVLLFGANGQVGTALRELSSPSLEIIAVTREGTLAGQACEKADFLQPQSLVDVMNSVKPDAVINAAAYTAVDRAETERDIAFKINAEAPGVIAQACATADVPLIHYSTDYVFDGSARTPYLPDSPPKPCNVYGESKLAGEHAIQEAGGNALILRTSWVYGNHGKNFFRTMLHLADRDQVSVVEDQFGNPTPTWLIAEITAKILRQGFADGGLHHLVTHGSTSWADFASTIFQGAVQHRLIDQAPIVLPIPSSEYPTLAKRPGYSVLDTSSLEKTFGVQLPTWESGLARTFEIAATPDIQ